MRRGRAGDPDVDPTKSLRPREEVSGGEHAGDRIEKRILRLLYGEKRRQTGDPRRLRARTLEWFARSGRANQKGSKGDYSRNSIRRIRSGQMHFHRPTKCAACGLGQVLLGSILLTQRDAIVYFRS